MVRHLPIPLFSRPLEQRHGLCQALRRVHSSLALTLLLVLGMGPFEVQATTCANAIVINPASLPITNQALVCGSTNDLNSTNVPGAICGSGSTDYYKGGNEALYSFTPTTTASYQLSYAGQTWSAAMVYVGCPTLNNCVYGSGQTGNSVSFAVTLNAGTTYYIWFDTWPSPASPCPGTFSLGPPPPPPGCGTVFYDSGGASGNYSANSNQTTTTCPSTPGDMVSLVFSLFDLEYGYDVLEFFDGNSTASPSLGGYTGTGTLPVFTANNPSGCLTVVFSSDGSGQKAGWAAQVFCSPMPAGDCVYALRLRDSAGNGWGSSSVGVRINGGAYTNYTVTTSNNLAFIGVNLGDLIELNYNNSGPNQNQNSYTLSTCSAGQFFTAGPSPVSGLSYSATAVCATAALPQDCIGGVTLCSNASITSNSTTSGCERDLDSSIHGCLLSDERQGTWYYFSPSSSGTLGLTITPQGNIDYDFALWGPYDDVQCPSNAPIRCSYANGLYTPTYNTGMGNGASDPSEDQFGNGWVSTLNVLADKIYVLYIDNYSSTGQAFNLTWQLSNGASLDCTTLPVELISLEAAARNTVIDVIWATATEENSSHFIVERSPDNEVFTPIGSLQAAGSAQFRSDYLFVDEAPYKGLNYYRLQQVDQDSHTEQTRTVVATLFADDGKPTIYPNPAKDVLNVVFRSSQEGQATLTVEDALGRAIARSTVEVLQGENKAEVPVSGVAKGWYNLRIALPDGNLLQGGAFLKQ